MDRESRLCLIGVFSCLFVTGYCHSGTLEFVQAAAATWTEAETICSELNKTLVTIENGTEHQRIKDHLDSILGGIDRRKLLGIGGSGMWIGLYYDESSATFHWISDGSETSYDDWVPGEPDNLPPGGTEIYVSMINSDPYQFQSEDGSMRMDVLCEENVVTTISTTVAVGTTSVPAVSEAQDSDPDYLGAILGGTLGGAAALGLLVSAVVCFLKTVCCGLKKRVSDKK